MKLESHPKIVTLYDAFDSKDMLYLVLELMSNSNLYDEIVERDMLTEQEASLVLEQVFEGVAFIHDQNIVHRDLKLENILLKTKGDLSCVKIADFGLSKNIGDSAPKTAVGTPFYVAPDLLIAMDDDSAYTQKIDMWAMGVLMFIILSGRLPFTGEDDEDLYENILEAKIILKSPQFDTVSKEAKHLIFHLLPQDPNDRLSAKQALQHEFIVENKKPRQQVSLHASLSTNLKTNYKKNR